MSHKPLQWITALDLDFTVQSNQTLNTDTTYTIGGLTWTKINSANDAVAMAITNGTGLVIQPTAATNISTTTFNSPTLQIPFTSIIPSFNQFMPLRIWIYESASNGRTSTSDRCVFGAHIYNAGFPNQYTLGFFRGFTGSTTEGWGGTFITLQSNVTITSSAIPLATNRVGVVFMPVGVLAAQSALLVGSTAPSNAWPSFSNLFIAAGPATTAAASPTFSSASSGNHGINDVNLFITALSNTASAGLSTTIAGIRVDYLPFNN